MDRTPCTGRGGNMSPMSTMGDNSPHAWGRSFSQDKGKGSPRTPPMTRHKGEKQWSGRIATERGHGQGCICSVCGLREWGQPLGLLAEEQSCVFLGPQLGSAQSDGCGKGYLQGLHGEACGAPVLAELLGRTRQLWTAPGLCPPVKQEGKTTDTAILAMPLTGSTRNDNFVTLLFPD